jgi:hypothetical protein
MKLIVKLQLNIRLFGKDFNKIKILSLKSSQIN